MTQRRLERNWQSDEEYIRDQDAESSWSSDKRQAWGTATANKFVKWGHYIGADLFHDDTVADFGGNDGYAAYEFYVAHKIKPLVVDCEPKRIEHADKVYKLPTLQRFIENMPELADKSITWGYTSHTLEHVRDLPAALREMARVVEKGCYFVLPLEGKYHAKHNHAHCVSFTKVKQWEQVMIDNGWEILSSEKVSKHECQIIARPVSK